MTDQSTNDELHEGGGGFFSREAVSGVPWMVFSKLVLFFVYFGVSMLTVNELGKDKFGVFSTEETPDGTVCSGTTSMN